MSVSNPEVEQDNDLFEMVLAAYNKLPSKGLFTCSFWSVVVTDFIIITGKPVTTKEWTHVAAIIVDIRDNTKNGTLPKQFVSSKFIDVSFRQIKFPGGGGFRYWYQMHRRKEIAPKWDSCKG